MRNTATRRQASLFFISLAAALPAILSVRPSAAMGGGPGHHEVTVKSGEPHRVGHHWPSSATGNPSPFSLKVTQPPKHGTVKIEQSAGVSSVIYQSKPGYIGRDDFTYIRVGSDKFAGTYTVGVTVK